MKLQYYICCLAVIVASLLASCDSTVTNAGNDDQIFPAENLEAATRYALDESNGLALIVWNNGNILKEEFRNSYEGDDAYFIFSGTKSFAGLLAALAVQNGLFTFDTRLSELIPEWEPDTPRGEITIRQLLNLISGIETAPVGASQTAEEWLAARVVNDTGSTFTYGPTPFYLFSWIFHETLQTDPGAYLNTHLLSPLGVRECEWLNVDNRYRNLSYGCIYPANDLLQVGVLLLNEGIINGETILKKDIFDKMLEPTEAAPNYATGFWLNRNLDSGSSFAGRIPGTLGREVSDRLISDDMPENLFMMSGAFGQKLYIVPSLDLVIVRYGQALQSTFSDQEFFSILTQNVNLEMVQ